MDAMTGSAAARIYLANGFLAIPGRKPFGKIPQLPHKPDEREEPKWTVDRAKKSMDVFDGSNFVGLLMIDNNIAVDFDTIEMFNEWYPLFKDDFDRTALCRTRHGFHVWFKRTPLCDELEITDGNIGYYPGEDGERGEKKPMDIKTRSSVPTLVPAPDGSFVTYYTPGYISVPPSPNKVWVRSIIDHPIIDIPDELVRRIRAEKNDSWREAPKLGTSKAAKVSRAPRSANKGGEGQPFWRPQVELNKHCLRAFGFPFSRMTVITEYKSMNSFMERAGYINGVAEFQLKIGSPCPICKKPEGHKNSYWLGIRADGSRRISNYNPTCMRKTDRFKSAITIPWTPKGAEAWVAAFYATGKPVPPTFLAFIFQELPEHSYPNPRDAIFVHGKTMVFKIGEADFVEISFKLGTLIRGWPAVRKTTRPWISLSEELKLQEITAGALFAFPIPAELFLEAAKV